MRSRSGDVDTGMFASWPLLRPDELATLSSDVLKASLAALDLLGGQTSDEDAIADYAQRQRERTTSILSERAAQVRVRALLTAASSPSTSIAPSHGIRSTDGASFGDRCSSSERETYLTPSRATTYFSHGSDGGCVPSLRSPPRAKVEHRQNRHQAGTFSGTLRAATPEASVETAQGRQTGDTLALSSHWGDDRKFDPDNKIQPECAPGTSSNGHLCNLNGPVGSSSDINNATDVGGACKTQRDTRTSRKDRGHSSFTSVVHEKWGSVFVVGGGQRRRRASVRRRSVEVEDTDAARRAHVEKDRQDRRKASLCRLLARKEQRALQQETRRRRRAAAARAKAAAAAATATAEAKAAGATSLTSTITSPTPSTVLYSARGATSLPVCRRPRSPTNSVEDKEGNAIVNGPAAISAPVPASPPPRAWCIDANAPGRELGARGRNADEILGRNEATVCEIGGLCPQGGVDQPCRGIRKEGDAERVYEVGAEQPCGGIHKEGDAEGVYENGGGAVCASSGTGGPDATDIRDGSSSESESVSGGDSSDADDFSADEGGEQKGSSIVHDVGRREGFERVTEARNIHLREVVQSDDAGIVDDQRAAPVEDDGDLSPPSQGGWVKGEAAAVVQPPQQRTNETWGDLTAALAPVEYSHDKGTAESNKNVTIPIVVRHCSVANKVHDEDVSRQMTSTTSVRPMTITSITAADDSEERSGGTDTSSDTEQDDDSGATGGHSDASALELPGPLDVEPLKGGSADGCIAREQSRFVSPTTTPILVDGEHDTPHQRQHQHLTTGNGAPATRVRPSLDERRSRRPPDTHMAKHLASGHRVSDTNHPMAPHSKDGTTTGGKADRLEGATVQRFACGPVAAPVRHRNKSLSSLPTTGGDGAGLDGGRSNTPASLGGYTECFPKFGAILSAYHNGRALTREIDCRSLPLTSSIMARGRGGRGAVTRLTNTEEEACLHLQLKLYAIYVRVIKDYAAVFSLGDDWPTNASEDPSSLVYSGDPSALHYRVNSKARPEVYNIVTDVLNNRCKQWEELPTGLGLKTTWNLLWTWSKPHIQYSSLLVWQKVNHFPNSRELTRKDLLNKHISRFMAPGGRLAREFHIMPQTFVLPHEFTAFVAAFTSSGNRSRDRGKSGGDTPPEYVGLDSFDDIRGEVGTGGGPEVMGGVRKKENVWIMKPVGMSRGRGIRLIDDIKNTTYADKVVLQRYIGNPLLLDGYKFDLRLYVLVTSFNPLEAFIYKEGFARLSTHLYERGDIGNPFIHLTNSSVQRLNELGATRDNPLHHANLSEAGGTKTTLSYLWRRLATSGVDVGELWAGICSVVVKSLVCVEGTIPNQPNSFELFGYDILIDDKLRPWLIEVNASPSMARDSHIDRQVKETLIFDTIHLVNPLPFDRQKLADVLEKRLSSSETSKARTFKERRASENFDQRNASAPPFESENERGAKTSAQGSRPRRRKDGVELERDLNDVLKGRQPRKVGEIPAEMGNFVRLCPDTAAHRHARRLRRRVIRPQPGHEDTDTNQ